MERVSIFAQPLSDSETNHIALKVIANCFVNYKYPVSLKWDDKRSSNGNSYISLSLNHFWYLSSTGISTPSSIVLDLLLSGLYFTYTVHLPRNLHLKLD